VATDFASHAGIQRKTKVTTPKWLVLTPQDVARTVAGLVRRPRANLVFPWPFRLSAWLNFLLPPVVDLSTVRGFTIPERADELKAAGLL
jgi:hypothetical protein